MTKMLHTMLQILLILFSPIIIYIIYFISFVIVYYCVERYYFKYPVKLVDSAYKIQSETDSFFKRLFIQFPYRFVMDRLNDDPYDFKEYGLHLFVGRQGSGKTMSMVELIRRWQRKYPKCKVITNFDYKYQDGNLKDWKDLINYNNGHFGVIKAIDEIQTWFSSKESGKLPYEMLGEISQQRKQRSTIIGTAQCFNRVIKEIREQVTYVYVPRTILGCLTIVKRTSPDFWDDEKQVFTKFDKTYFYVHTDDLRNSYDTYKKIERSVKVGFNERVTRSEVVYKNSPR